MAAIKGTNVIAPVVPFSTADVHPSHEARYGKGGYRTVATLVERDAIPAPRREAGMLVFVTADETTWRLEADLTTWQAYTADGSGPVEWSNVQGKPSTFAPSAHQHPIADVTGLQSALDAKQASGSYAAASHGHAIGDVTGLQSALNAKATPADVTAAVAAVVDAAPASLDTLNELAAALGDDANFASTVTNAIAGKAASVHSHVIADVTGLQTALDGKQASGSYAASVHTHGISDVTGLQTALDGKQAAGSYAAATHGHSISDVTGLQTALDGKQASGSYAASVHTHGISDVTGLQTALDGKQASGSYAAASHGHAISDVTGLQTALDGKAAASHTHTVSQIDATGTPSSTTFLRGDGAWAAAGSSSASDLTSGTLSNARLTSRARAAVNVFNWSSFR